MNLPALHSRLPKRSLLFIALGLFLSSFLSAWYFSVQPSIQHQQRLLQNYVDRQLKDANLLLHDSVLMRKLVVKMESFSELNNIIKKDYGLFLFAEEISDNQDIIFWNNQKILPPKADFSAEDGYYFHRLDNGYYVVNKKTLHFSDLSNKIIAYVMVPVLNQFYVETDYLVTTFVHNEEANNKISIVTGVTNYPINSLNRRPLFWIKEVPHPNVTTTDLLTVVLRIMALIFLFIYASLLAESIVTRSRPFYGVAFLAIAFILFRLLMFRSEEFFAFRQFALFDPSFYAVNTFNSSLGDLLINATLLCWIVLFTWYSVSPDQKIPRFLKGKKLYVAGFAAIFVLIFATFQFANTVRSLVADSKVSFNVTDFFGLDVYTVIGFIVLALISLTYYYFTRLLFRFIFSAFRDNYNYIYFTLAFIGLLFLTFRSGNSIVLFHLPVLLWLVLYTLLVSQEKFIINRFRVTVAGALFWIFVFSVSLGAIILQANRENELRIRKAIAEKYDRLTDPTNNYQLSIAITYLDNRFLVNNFQRFKQPGQNRFLRDSILKENFTDYNIKYDTKIYVFDSSYKAINNEDPKTYAQLNTIFSVQSKPTGIPDLNYLETSFDKLTYITRRVIRNGEKIVGSFFIIFNPRQYGSDALYPELFRQVNKRDDENSPLYSYAIYKDGNLTISSNKYPFQISITKAQTPRFETEERTNEEYDELWYRAAQDKIVVIARKKDSLLESITLFSYLFCAFLFMVGLLQLISIILRLFRERTSFSFFSQFSIRSQIQGTVIFISLLSFLIIGVATISFFIERYNRNNVDKLSRTAGIMVKELEKRLNDSTANNYDDLSDSSSYANLQKLVNEVADIHNADVNVYSLDGNLKVSSENEVYEKGILSKQMHPLAYYKLSRLHQVQLVQKESLSSLSYWSIYASVRKRDGKVAEYLNIPSFTSQIDLKQEISNFLVTIINLNAFIFLIAGVIALFITNKITQSFSVIGDKMRDITLGKTNEPIIWNKNDEIGQLVKQYNKMVLQLEQSADALARSEREGAWREMARQVAHEIKNPLTPMKLSIQYLQRAIDSNQANVKELTAGVANTLIEQIDHLSKIAADFSQFANIGNKKIELVDLHQVLGILVDLYSSNPKVRIQWNKVFGSVVMKADKTHMNRVFTNLFANALDACQEKPFCNIKIDEVQKDGLITISVKDNGEGIPDEMRSKIFTPNFTTKTSGTGLGLAMTKSIVEQAKGNIWFETEVEKGTTFFVQLPVIS